MIKIHVPPAIEVPFLTVLLINGSIPVAYVSSASVIQPSWKPGLVFGYSLASKLDPNCTELHVQTIARCKVAARAYRDHEVDDLFITCRLEDTGMRMANLMQACLIENGVPKERVHVIDPGFTTRTITEIQIFQKALHFARQPEGCATEIVAFSSWYHMKRIRMMFTHLGIKLRGWSSTSKSCGFDLFIEIIKIAYFWKVPGVGKHFGDINLPSWVIDPSIEEPIRA